MEVKVTFLDGGYCTHNERMVSRRGRFQTVKFPSMFVLIEHPSRGYVLYDTGYSRRFYEETRRFPAKLYAMLTPVFVTGQDCAVEKLKTLGVSPHDVSHVVISHFHADHIGGLRDFPQARFLYLRSCFERVRYLQGLRAARAGFLAGLLPEDFVERSTVIGGNMKCRLSHVISEYFSEVFDVFGDGSIVAVELPGHVRGQIGLYLRTGDTEYFLVADSCWLTSSYRDNVLPSRLTALITDDYAQYRATVASLHEIWKRLPQLQIVPSHCGEFFQKLVKNCNWDSWPLNGVAA